MSCRVLTREYSYANTPQNPLALQSLRFAVFDGLDVVQERDNNNRVTAQLVRDGNINGILSRVTNAGAAYYGYDGNGNVTLLTDANGSDVGHYRYDAFGQTLEAVGPRASENPYRFSTKPIHERSGLIDFGFRFYSPCMGRWMNRDPLQEAGGINLYAMVGNNPVNDVDEYGLAPAKDNRPCANDGIAGSCATQKEQQRMEQLERERKARADGGASVERQKNKAAGKGGGKRYKGVDVSYGQLDSIDSNNRGQKSKRVADSQGKSSQAAKQSTRNMQQRGAQRRVNAPDMRPAGSPERRVGGERRAYVGSSGGSGSRGGGGGSGYTRGGSGYTRGNGSASGGTARPRLMTPGDTVGMGRWSY